MTVVAAVARGGVVTMAADTATNYAGTGILGARKIQRVKLGSSDTHVDEALIAASGSGALLSLVQHWSCDHVPDPADELDVEHWATACAVALSELAAEATPPVTATDDGGPRLDGAFLLGWRGRLIYLFTHQAVLVPRGVAALGIGTDYALGFMEAALDHGIDTRAPDHAWTVRAAVEGACERYDGCRCGPTGPLVETLEPAS